MTTSLQNSLLEQKVSAVENLITILHGMRERPVMYIGVCNKDVARSYLDGIQEGLSLAGMDIGFYNQLHSRVELKRGWGRRENSAADFSTRMEWKGFSQQEIVREMCEVEIEVLERVLKSWKAHSRSLVLENLEIVFIEVEEDAWNDPRYKSPTRGTRLILKGRVRSYLNEREHTDRSEILMLRIDLAAEIATKLKMPLMIVSGTFRVHQSRDSHLMPLISTYVVSPETLTLRLTLKDSEHEYEQEWNLGYSYRLRLIERW